MKPKENPFCFPHKPSFPFLWWGDGKLHGRWEEKVLFRIIIIPHEKLEKIAQLNPKELNFLASPGIPSSSKPPALQ